MGCLLTGRVTFPALGACRIFGQTETESPHKRPSEGTETAQMVCLISQQNSLKSRSADSFVCSRVFSLFMLARKFALSYNNVHFPHNTVYCACLTTRDYRQKKAESLCTISRKIAHSVHTRYVISH